MGHLSFLSISTLCQTLMDTLFYFTFFHTFKKQKCLGFSLNLFIIEIKNHNKNACFVKFPLQYKTENK